MRIFAVHYVSNRINNGLPITCVANTALHILTYARVHLIVRFFFLIVLDI